MARIDVVVLVGEVYDEANLGVLGAQVLECGVCVNSDVGCCFVEWNILEVAVYVFLCFTKSGNG